MSDEPRNPPVLEPMVQLTGVPADENASAERTTPAMAGSGARLKVEMRIAFTQDST